MWISFYSKLGLVEITVSKIIKVLLDIRLTDLSVRFFECNNLSWRLKEDVITSPIQSRTDKFNEAHVVIRMTEYYLFLIIFMNLLVNFYLQCVILWNMLKLKKWVSVFRPKYVIKYARKAWISTFTNQPYVNVELDSNIMHGLQCDNLMINNVM